MERIEIVQAVANNFPETKTVDALAFAGLVERGFRRQMEDARYKAENEKYSYGEEQYERGVKAGKDSVRTVFDPQVITVTQWAVANFSTRDLTRKIQCIKMLREKFQPLGLLEAKSIVDMITPMNATGDALDWPKIEGAEKPSPADMPQKRSVDSNSNGSRSDSDRCNCGDSDCSMR